MTLSRQDFNRQCLEFIKKTQALSQGWQLMVNNGRSVCEVLIGNGFDCRREEQLMLIKNEVKRLDKSDILCNCDYTVVYSESFEVPVMYFNMSDQGGCPLTLDANLELASSLARGNETDLMINQVEHPFLFRPFYMIHPCRTKEFMQEVSSPGMDGYLITWLSSIANLIGLQFVDPNLDYRIEPAK